MFTNYFALGNYYASYLKVLEDGFLQLGIIINYGSSVLMMMIFDFVFDLVVNLFFCFGLYLLSKKNGIDRPWLSFIPFARFYQMGRLVGKMRVFGKKVNNLGLIVAIAAAVNFVLQNVNDIIFNSGTVVEIIASGNFVVPKNTDSVVYDLMEILCDIVYVVYTIGFVFLVFPFFKYYERRHPILYTLVGVFFGITGIFVFVVRNHEKYDYISAERARYDAFYSNYGDRFGGGQNRYYDGYGGNFNGAQKDKNEKKDEEVFEEYASNDDKGANNVGGKNFDPFDDSGDDLF